MNTAQTINKGDVFKINMTKDNGLILKKEYNDRIKYFVVLGFDNKGNIYGGIVINSKINQNLPPIIKQYHLPISATKYTFLRYNSYLNCANILTANPTELLKGEKVGSIEKEELNIILQAVCSYPNATPIQLKRFNLI